MNASNTSRNAIASRAFQWWLRAGVVLTLLFPALRGFDPAYGWWPMWLVALPLGCLMLLRPSASALLAAAVAFPGLRVSRAPARRQAVRYRVSR